MFCTRQPCVVAPLTDGSHPDPFVESHGIGACSCYVCKVLLFQSLTTGPKNRAQKSLLRQAMWFCLPRIGLEMQGKRGRNRLRAAGRCDSDEDIVGGAAEAARASNPAPAAAAGSGLGSGAPAAASADAPIDLISEDDEAPKANPSPHGQQAADGTGAGRCGGAGSPAAGRARKLAQAVAGAAGGGAGDAAAARRIQALAVRSPGIVTPFTWHAPVLTRGLTVVQISKADHVRHVYVSAA